MHARPFSRWLIIVCLPGLALAHEYTVSVEGVESEQDLRELSLEGSLEDDEFERLLALIDDPVDLNDASRDTLYELPGLSWAMVDAIIADREKSGRFTSVGDLARVPGVPADVVRELEAFARTPAPWRLDDFARGKLRLKSAWRLDRPDADKVGSAAEEAPPTASAFLDAEIGEFWNVGLGFVTGRELLDPQLVERPLGGGAVEHYYETRLSQRHDLAKMYVHTPRRGRAWSAIVGSYRVGFGMGTVLDNTGRDLPDGWRADKDIETGADAFESVPVRFRGKPRFFGATAALHHLPAGSVHLSAQAFFSRIDRNSYLLLRRVPGTDFDKSKTCGDSETKEGEEIKLCEGAASRTKSTILDAFRETTAGGHVLLHLGPATEVGATAWWGTVDFLLEPTDALEFAPSARYPRDPSSFGAFGAHTFIELTDEAMLRAEYGRTLDGGNALWARGFYDTGPFEAELSLRAYEAAYENPHASPYAQGDEFEGHRARDERGVLWRLSWRDGPGLKLRLKGDIWKRPNKLSSPTSMRHEFSVTWRPVRPLQLTFRPSYGDNDIDEGTIDTPFSDGPGSKLDLYGKIKYDALDWLSVAGTYRHRLEDDLGTDAVFLGVQREDFYVVGELMLRRGRTRLNLRYKHNEEAVGHPTVTSNAGSYDQYSLKLKQLKTAGLFDATLRYDLVHFTDERPKWDTPSPDDPGTPNSVRNHHLLAASATLHF